MPSLQNQILAILSKSGELSLDELVAKVLEQNEALRDAQVRGALFPLMSTHQIEVSKDQKLKLTRDLAHK